MKRVTQTQRRLMAFRQRRWIARRQRGDESSVVTVTTAKGSYSAKRLRKIAMPEVMCFDRSPAETIAILADIRKNLNGHIRALNKRKRLRRRPTRRRSTVSYRAFEDVKYISPAAALILAAEYDRWREVTDHPMTIYNLEGWDDGVRFLLQEIGFLDIFALNNQQRLPILGHKQIVVRMRSGKTHDPTDIDGLVTDLERLSPWSNDDDGAVGMGLYSALTEAVGDVLHHAYPSSGSYVKPSVRRWWMTGAVDQDQHWTSAAVYDQGVTIPVSLPGWDKYSGVVSRLFTAVQQSIGLAPDYGDAKWDGRAIAAAVEESVSSTGQAGRGLGLAQMREFVDGCRSGHLRILSRHGEVVFRPNETPHIRTYQAPIGGTLVEWNVLV